MNIIEYQPSTVRSRAEHQRMIRDMTRDLKGMLPNPIARALCEMAAAAAGCGVWIALCVMAWKWFLMI